MRVKSTLSILVLVSLFAACSDVNAPSRTMSAGSRPSAFGFCDNPDDPCFDLRALPPPPSFDTTAIALNTDGSAFTGAPVVHVTYFMNKTENNGWVMFNSSDGVVASPNAKISIHQGTVSGKGTVQLIVPGSVLSIDLSKNVSGKSTFNGDCSKSCGTILISGATLTPKVGKPSIFNGQLVIGGIIGPD